MHCIFFLVPRRRSIRYFSLQVAEAGVNFGSAECYRDFADGIEKGLGKKKMVVLPGSKRNREDFRLM